jgi:vancomycin aglycone glucosyltransferase
MVVGYGSRGDLEPLAALGRELTRRGHDVRMTAPPNMRGFVRSAGLDPVTYGPDSRTDMNPAGGLIRNVLPSTGNPFSMMTQIAQHVGEVKSEKCATLLPLAKDADLIVAGFNEQGLAAIVAEHVGIPVAGLHYFPSQIWAEWKLHETVTKQTDDAQRQALGLPAAPEIPAELLEVQAYDKLNLPLPADDWVEPGELRPFVGALTLELPSEADEDVLSWIAADRPPIYFGFGSTPVASPAKTLSMIGAACEQLGERALICSGPNNVAGLELPGHVKVVEAVSHAAILPACRAAVHHGGSGTTAAALRAGIPTLILWFWLDQPVWATGVEQLKIGVAREFSESTPETLVADLRSILTPEYRSRASLVATQMTTPTESISRAANLAEYVAG